MAKKHEDDDLWERQLREPPLQFTLFEEYLRDGPTRSLKETADIHNKSITAMRHMCATWDWVERVEAYDKEMFRVRDEEYRKGHATLAARHCQLGIELQKKAMARLRTMDLTKLKPAEVVRFAEVGVKIERLARGLDTDQVRTVEVEEITHTEVSVAHLTLKELKHFDNLISQQEINT